MPVDPEPEGDFTICCLDVIAGESQPAASPLSSSVLCLLILTLRKTSLSAA